MKREAAHDFFVVNHELRPTADMAIFDKISTTAIYEVIQIRQGIPLFFEAHMERFRHSASLTGIRIHKQETEIQHEILDLVEKNKCDHVNVKLLSTTVDGQATFLTYFVPAEFPDSKSHAEGVHTILFPGERISPNIKTIQGSYREQVRAARQASNAYEALLMDKAGYITEGSRSNVFFVGKDGKTYTSPAGSVLIGVTRTMVMKICGRLGLPVVEKTLHRRDLTDIQGAFITGTTVDVTPIRSISRIHLDSATNPLVRRIEAEYENEIAEYIRKKRVVS